MAILLFTHSRFPEQCVYTRDGLNLDNVCLRLAQRVELLPQWFISNSWKPTAGCSSAQQQIFKIAKHTRKYGQTKQLWLIPSVNLSKSSNYRKQRDANQTMGQLVYYSIYNCLFFE